MKAHYTMLPQHQSWKLFQRLEQPNEIRGMSAAELGAQKEKLWNAEIDSEKHKTEESSHSRACAAASAQQLQAEKALTQWDVAQRRKTPLALIQRVEDNTLPDFTYYELYRLGNGSRLKHLLKSLSFLST